MDERFLGVKRAVALVVASTTLAACGSTTTKTVTTVARSLAPPATSPATTPTQATGTATTATTSAASIYFEGVAGGPKERPSTLELTGDGTLYVDRVQWTSWGG